jgi:hypothetical protein
MKTVHANIKWRVSRKKKGEIIFPTDIRGVGTEARLKSVVKDGPERAFKKIGSWCLLDTENRSAGR